MLLEHKIPDIFWTHTRYGKKSGVAPQVASSNTKIKATKIMSISAEHQFINMEEILKRAWALEEQKKLNKNQTRLCSQYYKKLRIFIYLHSYLLLPLLHDDDNIFLFLIYLFFNTFLMKKVQRKELGMTFFRELKDCHFHL